MKSIFFLPIKKVRLAQLGMVAVAVEALGCQFTSGSLRPQGRNVIPVLPIPDQTLQV
jgi:hypothetical protein